MSIPGYKVSQLNKFTPEQMQLFQSLFGGIGGQAGQGANLLGKFALGDSSAYEAMEKPAINTFNQQIIPGLAQRFSQSGTLNSSAFANAGASAGANLADSLSAQRSQYQFDALARLLGLSEHLLDKQPYDNVLTKKSNFWDKFGSVLGGLGGLGGDIGSILGGVGAFKAGSGLAGSLLGGQTNSTG